MGTTRIRWHEGGGNDIKAWRGCAGDVNGPGVALFSICRPEEEGSGFTLICDLPGMTWRTLYREDPEELKAEAENWLTEFASSIGAVFPEAE